MTRHRGPLFSERTRDIIRILSLAAALIGLYFALYQNQYPNCPTPLPAAHTQGERP